MIESDLPYHPNGSRKMGAIVIALVSVLSTPTIKNRFVGKINLFIFLVIYGVATSILPLRAQCNLRIDVGKDTIICSAQKVTLKALVEGTVLSAKWSPDPDLNNVFTFWPTVLVSTTTTYRLLVDAYDERANLIHNADFSLGNEGFSSQYEANSTTAGGYIIGTIGTELFPEAETCVDHTSRDGNMMMVKLSNTTNLDIWCQEVAVQTNRTYHFAAYATKFRNDDPPIIEVTINNERLSSRTLGPFACSWQNIYGNWASQNNTQATICLRASDDDIGTSNHLALDDIGFYELCKLEDDIKVEVTPFFVSTSNPVVQLPCNERITLSANVATAGNNYTVQWRTDDGNIVTGGQSLSPLIDAPGTYHFTASLSDTSADCTEELSILVEEISTNQLSIAKPGSLNCQQAELELSALHDGSVSDFNFQWSTSDGHIVAGQDEVNATIDAPGRYTLTLTEKESACQISSEIEIVESKLDSFSYDLEVANCDNELGAIHFETISGGTPPYIYAIDDGLNFQNTMSFPALVAGSYALVVRDSNNCELSTNVVLPAVPTLTIALASRIKLDKGSPYTINSTLSLPDSLISRIRWTPETGLDCTDCLTPSFIARQTTTYTLSVLGTNGCETSAAILVEVVEPSDVYLPNAFSPNQDGQNDIFYIQGDAARIEIVRQLVIFDRYGSMVFEAQNFPANTAANGWNGQLNGKLLSAGIYTYFTVVELVDGEVENFKGEVLLLR